MNGVTELCGGLVKNWNSRNFFYDRSSIIASCCEKAASSLGEIGHSPSNDEEGAFG